MLFSSSLLRLLFLPFSLTNTIINDQDSCCYKKPIQQHDTASYFLGILQNIKEEPSIYLPAELLLMNPYDMQVTTPTYTHKKICSKPTKIHLFLFYSRPFSKLILNSKDLLLKCLQPFRLDIVSYYK